MKKHWKTLKESFMKREFSTLFVCNALFVILTLFLSKITTTISKKQFTLMENVNLDNLPQQTEDQLMAISNIAKSFIKTIILVTIAFIIIEVIIWAILQWKIYQTIHKKKFPLRKFIYMNLVWIPIWAIILLVAVAGGRFEAYNITSTIILLIFLHFTLILYNECAKKCEWKTIGASLKKGINLKNYIIPYIAIAVIFFIASAAASLTTQLPAIAAQTINLILLIVIFSWIQLYTNSID